MGIETPAEWHNFSTREILKLADRLSVLVTRNKAHRQIKFVSMLDFMLGALHELVRAEHYGFRHMANRQPELVTIQNRADQFAAGRWASAGNWMAGLHFNSAIVRLAAVHDRSMKLFCDPDEK